MAQVGFFVVDRLSYLTGDVNITAPADLNLLQYDGASSKWVNRTIATMFDATYLRLDATNDPVTGLLNITNSVQIQGNYYLSFRDLTGVTNYMYMMASTPAGGGARICAVATPFQLQYGALGSSVALSLDTNGNVVWNYDAGNCDFTINKNTAGQAYVYDAGADTHTFDGYATFGDGWKANDDCTMKAGKKLYFDGA